VGAGVHHWLETNIMEGKPLSAIDDTRRDVVSEKLALLLKIIPEDIQTVEYSARLMAIRRPEDPNLPPMLERLLNGRATTPAYLLGAYVAACRKQLSQVNANLQKIMDDEIEFEIPINRRAEFLIRDDAGPILLEVRGGSPNWVQWGERIYAGDFELGSKVSIELTMGGLKCVVPQAE
jgi:hypothetical protein